MPYTVAAMKRLLLACVMLLPCTGFPVLDRADNNVLMVAIPAHIGNSESGPPIDGRAFNAIMVHVKPLRAAAEILITITYRDTTGNTGYVWIYTVPGLTGYAVAALAVPTDATVESVDAEGLDEHRNSLWWSGFSSAN